MQLDAMISDLRVRWGELPDGRKPNNNRQYEMADAAMAAFSVFFMQSPSFLAHQHEMAQRKGRSNAGSLFRFDPIPSDGQIRNLLDGLQPGEFGADFERLHEQLRDSGQRAQFIDHAGTVLIALDGLTFFSSKKIHCPECQQRQDSYFHSAVTPVIVKSDSPQVLPLMPEFVVPQDGSDKQDCERNAAKRWLQRFHASASAPTPRSITYLGDDLYANQPFCEFVRDVDQYFLCVAKPDSHVGLYAVLAELERLERLHTFTHKHFNGRHYELWTFRCAQEVPLRGDLHALLVNWLEITVTDARTGKRLYFNTWVTNHAVGADSVFALASAGRARWKIENENNNVLKNHGYHLEHNFGHGKQHLANVLFTLNLLAFLTHTVQELTAKPYQMLRAALKTRRAFFNDLRALTRYHLFESWHHLWRFMLESLEVVFDPALLFSD